MKQLLLFLLITTTGFAQWTQIGSDIDGEVGSDHSGRSVSLSSNGNILAIGAQFNNGNGSNSGHVRVYENQSGTWTQIGSDIDGEVAGDESGFSVSLSSNGSIVAIGAYKNDGNGADSGHVRVYENQSGTWTQIGDDINGEAPSDYSGRSISLSSDGSIIAIGADGNDGNGNASGHVRVYENQSGTWTQIGSDINGEAAVDLFGYAVSLSSDGTILAVGAQNNDNIFFNSGHVRVFENQSGVWTQIGNDIDGEASQDLSGYSVSLSSDGTIVAIGAIQNNGNGSDSGHVRVYENQSGVWTQIGDDIDGEAANDYSGFSVSLSSDGNIVAIGAHFNDGNGSNAGHVRIFKNESGVWTQIGDDIDGEAGGDNAGRSISLSSDGSIIAIGADGNDGNGSASGHVRVFEFETTTLSSTKNVIDGLLISFNNGMFISNLENVTLEVSNTLGQQTTNKNLGTGIYIVKATHENGNVETHKILIQ